MPLRVSRFSVYGPVLCVDWAVIVFSLKARVNCCDGSFDKRRSLNENRIQIAIQINIIRIIYSKITSQTQLQYSMTTTADGQKFQEAIFGHFLNRKNNKCKFSISFKIFVRAFSNYRGRYFFNCLIIFSEHKFHKN